MLGGGSGALEIWGKALSGEQLQVWGYGAWSRPAHLSLVHLFELSFIRQVLSTCHVVNIRDRYISDPTDKVYVLL